MGEIERERERERERSVQRMKYSTLEPKMALSLLNSVMFDHL